MVLRVNRGGGTGRRTFLAGTASLAALASARRARAAEPVTINVSGYGGVLNEYLTRIFGQPFEQKTGIKVNFGANASLALAKLQVAAGPPAQWDIIVLTGAEYVTAVETSLIAPYDYGIIGSSHIPPEYKQSHGVKLSLYLFFDVLGPAADPGRQGAQDLGGVLGHGAVQGQAVALLQRVGRQHPGAGLAGGRRGARQALPARRGPRPAQPRPAGASEHHLAHHQPGADPATHLRRPCRWPRPSTAGSSWPTGRARS